jgi:hypothetical protein
MRTLPKFLAAFAFLSSPAPAFAVNLIIEVGKGRPPEPDSPREDRGSSQ